MELKWNVLKSALCDAAKTEKTGNSLAISEKVKLTFNLLLQRKTGYMLCGSALSTRGTRRNMPMLTGW